jgi:hypothetical protein
METPQARLADLGTAVVWLDPVEAAIVFDRIRPCFDESRYGLSKTSFDPPVERVDVDAPADEVRTWLEARIGRGPELVLVAYTREDVCEVPARLFLSNWASHFCPPDDEIAVLPRYGGWILCYFRGDQFEFGRSDPA